ncbi:hypothetical protein, partial [Frankia sp. KB5]
MPTARISLREEQDDLRSRMRALGLSHGQVALEFATRYRLRPREAWRRAHGWTYSQAARQINTVAAQTGFDTDGRAAMTGPTLCEVEKWPGSTGRTRKPTPRTLALLATAYGAQIQDLLDLDDREHFTAAERLTLDGLSRAAPPQPIYVPPERSPDFAVGSDHQQEPASLGLPDRPVLRRAGGMVEVAVDRRDFLAGTATLPPFAAMELTRHDLLSSLTAGGSGADLDEWRQVVWEYALSYGSSPPAVLLRRLDTDLSMLGTVARRQTDDTAVRELRRIGALLAAFTAHATADVGDLPASQRWWRTAKQAADASGDLHTRLWTRGREIVRALYEQRPLPAVLDLVAEADAITAQGGVPPEAVQEYLDGKARAFVRAGRNDDARTALTDVQANFERLPDRVRQDTASWFGWSERALRLAESYTYSHLGDYTRAD